MSRETVSRALKQLISIGYLKKELVYEGKEITQRNLYPDKGIFSASDSVKMTKGAGSECHKGVHQNDTRGYVKMTQINKQVNKQDNKQVIKPLGKKQLLKTITLNYTNNTRLIQTLYDFIDMRSEMKKSFTENSYRKFLHRLDSGTEYHSGR